MKGMIMIRRLLAPLLSICLALPAAAQEIPLNAISNYLNGITTAEADFTQANADGSTSRGKLYIHRPGRMRFEYAPPDKSIVIAGSGSVAIFDPKSNQPPQQYPLSQTPLNLILAPQIDLGRAKMVVSHSEQQGRTVVVAQDPAHPDYGTLALIFTPDPVALRQWVVTDSSGQRTTVTLDDLTPVSQMRDSLFNLRDAMGGNGARRN